MSDDGESSPSSIHVETNDNDPDGGNSRSDDDDVPPGGEGLSEEIYEVDRILGHLREGDDLFYKVRWLGYGEDEDSYEPAENLGAAKKAIDSYWEALGRSPDDPDPIEKRKGGRKKGRGRASKEPTLVAKRNSHDSKDKKQKSSAASSSAKVLEKPKSRSNPRGKRESPERANEEPERTPSPESPPDSDSDDENSFRRRKSTSGKSNNRTKPVSKAALKSYENSSPTVSKARMTAQKHRTNWLYESSDDDNEDGKGTKQSEDTSGAQHAEPVTPEPATIKSQAQEAPKVEPLKLKRKAGEPIEESKRVKRTSDAANDVVVDSAHSSADTNSFSSAETVGGIILRDKKFCVVLVKENPKSKKIESRVVTLEEAHAINSWSLVQELVARIRCPTCE